MKRFRAPRQIANTLKAQWGKLEGSDPDLCYAWGEGVEKCDARLLHYTFTCGRLAPLNPAKIDPSFIEELERRGYDITTFRFSIKKKAEKA